MSVSPDRADGSRPRRPTIVDVAQLANVSTAAVSKVLRNAYGVSPTMRERVQHAVSDLNYRPRIGARAMRGSATGAVGISSLELRNPFNGLLLDGIQHVLDQEGYGILIALSGPGPAAQWQSAESVIDHQMDGLILFAPRMTPTELEDLARLIPTVVIGLHGTGAGYDSVASDDAAGARLVVDHLVALGHRRISYHTQRVSQVPGLPETFREAGFREAMLDHGLVPDVIDGLWTEQGGTTAARSLLARARPPTAVHAGADVAAVALLLELLEQDLAAPGDLSVAGCDNTPIGRMPPFGLTSVDQDAHAMGEQAARLLIDRIRRPRPGSHFLHPPRLVVRTSTGGPPASRAGADDHPAKV